MEESKLATYYHFFIESILCQENMQEALKKINKKMFDNKFCEILDAIIDVDIADDYYDDFLHERLKQLIDYLVEIDKDLFTNIKEKYESYPKKQSANFYANQMYMKNNSVKSFINNKTFIWNVKDIHESVVYDFSTLHSFLVSDVQELVGNFNEYINQNKFCYFVSRLMSQYPGILLDDDLRQKIELVLECNISVAKLEDSEMRESAVKDYMEKNYRKKTDANSEICYFRFTLDSTDLYNRIKGKQIYEDPCNTVNYINIYNYNEVICGMFDKEININPYLLQPTINYIKRLGDHEFTGDRKDQLVRFMNKIRSVIGKDKIEEYNNCLIYINDKPEVPTANEVGYGGFFNAIIKICDYIQTKINERDEVNSIAYQKLFNYLNKDAKLLSPAEAYDAINNLMKDYPILFLDNFITDKLLKLVDIKKEHKLDKKITKLRDKRKV